MEDDGIESECTARPPGLEVRERESGGEQEEEQEREKRQKLENGGGLLDNLLSKLGSPRAPKPADFNDDHKDDTRVSSLEAGHGGDGDEGGGSGSGSGGGGGGMMDKISSFFHRNNTESEGEDVKESKDGSIEEGVKNGNEEVDQGSENGTTTNGGSSFISNLVPELMAPPGDEASILIHSVVHD